MPTKRDYQVSERERAARESGRSIGHYAAKVTKKLASPKKRGRSTPSKRG